ncbi:response regulator [Duganella sp. FT50W]|uniref:Response regulator n=1 Tax=Duganella lactea TaxID=2692173 RepID=A0A6L8MDD3_9BURK|nr:response regulator [Duganella lactea]
MLIVDDNEDAADMLALLLRTLGYITAVAYNGVAALAELDSFQPNVILLDMNMPVLNGYDTALAVRARPDGKSFHIIALTAYDDPAAIERMVKAGCDARITKPAPTEKLLALFP